VVISSDHGENNSMSTGVQWKHVADREERRRQNNKAHAEPCFKESDLQIMGFPYRFFPYRFVDLLTLVNEL
jgi:hypothetical protein